MSGVLQTNRRFQADVDTASVTAIAALDERFFRVRFDRLTPREKKYLRAMAELGAGSHRSGDVAACFDAKVSSLAPTRSSLNMKGMVGAPTRATQHSLCLWSTNS